MLNHKIFIAASMIAASVASTGHAHACSSINVDSRGYAQDADIANRGCNDTRVLQRGGNNSAQVRTGGNGHETTVSQVGNYQHTRVNVTGRSNQTHVFTGICPAGSRGWDVNVDGADRLGVFILPCR